MESLLNRYRNITVLLLVIMAQLVLLAVDTKVQGVPLIRVWAVTAVTPLARVLEGIRGGSVGFLHSYILLHDATAENRRLKAALDRLKLENIALKNDLNTADRAKALQVFQSKTPSKTVAATVIATGAGANSHVVFVDRGTTSGVMRGMAVVTPDGIVGKVIAAYPIASEVLLVTDPDFAAGVVSQRGVHGNLKGQGTTQCRLDYVPTEDKLDSGEVLYTSGDDRVFPRGFPAGVVKSVRPGQPFKEVLVEPLGLRRGLEDVLILIEGAHQAIPQAEQPSPGMYIAPAPPQDGQTADPAQNETPRTEADRLRNQYKAVGEAQGHNFGENPAGSKAVDFTKLGQPAAPAAQPATPATNQPASNAGTPPATPKRGAPAPVSQPPNQPTARQPAAQPANQPASNAAAPSATPKRGAPAPVGQPPNQPTTQGPATPPANQPASNATPSATPKRGAPAPEPPGGNVAPQPPAPKPGGGRNL